MNPCEIEEYRALRATIRERGTARVALFVLGLSVWAGVTAASAQSAGSAVSSLFPLLLLAAVFEAMFSLHTGVERIGRYLQVFFEENEAGTATGVEGIAPVGRGWEHVAMTYGKRFPGGSDPLFAWFFWGAILLGLAAAVPRLSGMVDWLIVGVPHVLLFAHIGGRRRGASRQREVDLARFRVLKRDGRGTDV